jgi:iron complex transport system substrate-binding protein
MNSIGKKSAGIAVWIVVVAVAVAAIGFTSGYYLGKINAEQSAGIAVIDDYGRTIELKGTPKRIVSTAPTPTEILFAVGAGNLVVGVDDYSDYPAEAANLTKVGSFELNVEAILSLKPDLVVSSDLVPMAQLDLLEQQGIPYMILAARTLDDVFKDLKMVGVITGHIQQADVLVDQLEARVDAVKAKTLADNVSKPKVYLEFYPLWTYGPGSFGDDLIKLAGGTNIAGNTSAEYVPLTDEFVIAQNPDIIVYTVGTNYNGTTPETIAARPGWSGISAVVNGKVYSIDDNLVSRYGPRIVDALEQLAGIIHPELF